MQLAQTARERGHVVDLWERNDKLGGQAHLAAQLQQDNALSTYLDLQEQRLGKAGVNIRMGTEATLESVMDFEADIVAVATGAQPRRPDIPGVEDTRVFDYWKVATGTADLGQSVAIIVQDNHFAPLTIADHIASTGRNVTLFIQTNSPAPLLSRYTIGAILGRLSLNDVRIICMEAVTSISLPAIHTRNIYSQRPHIYNGFDNVVLACGGLQDTTLFDMLATKLPNVHILGDAYAPRRLVFATQQGHELGKCL